MRAQFIMVDTSHIQSSDRSDICTLNRELFLFLGYIIIQDESKSLILSDLMHSVVSWSCVTLTITKHWYGRGRTLLSYCHMVHALILQSIEQIPRVIL